MCINSCLAYVGPYSDHDHCPTCGEDRYDPIKSTHKKKVPCQQFHTIPIGPQLQALWRSPEGSQNMRYLDQRTEELLAELEDSNGHVKTYDDICCGSDYIKLAGTGTIKPGDVMLMLSIDGAQLYKNKASDTWIWIWIILNLSPDPRYKKKYVLPGGFLPGPRPPGNPDSFLVPSLHHVAALMNDGLPIWDAQRNITFISQVFLSSYVPMQYNICFTGILLPLMC